MKYGKWRKRETEREGFILFVTRSDSHDFVMKLIRTRAYIVKTKTFLKMKKRKKSPCCVNKLIVFLFFPPPRHNNGNLYTFQNPHPLSLPRKCNIQKKSQSISQRLSFVLSRLVLLDLVGCLKTYQHLHGLFHDEI